MDDRTFHCKILGVDCSASEEEIKRAYHESAKILHPDKHDNSSVAKQKFQQLKESYEYLMRAQATIKDESPKEHKKKEDIRTEIKPEVLSTMEAFIAELVEEIHKPDIKGNILKSIAITALGNLISLPFGRVFVSVSRPKSKADIRTEFESSLYGTFKVGWLDDEQSRREKENDLKDLKLYFDVLPLNLKIKVLTCAVKSPKEYSEFLKANDWKRNRAS